MTAVACASLTVSDRARCQSAGRRSTAVAHSAVHAARACSVVALALMVGCASTGHDDALYRLPTDKRGQELARAAFRTLRPAGDPASVSECFFPSMGGCLAYEIASDAPAGERLMAFVFCDETVQVYDWSNSGGQIKECVLLWRPWSGGVREPEPAFKRWWSDPVDPWTGDPDAD